MSDSRREREFVYGDFRESVVTGFDAGSALGAAAGLGPNKAGLGVKSFLYKLTHSFIESKTILLTSFSFKFRLLATVFTAFSLIKTLYKIIPFVLLLNSLSKR